MGYLPHANDVRKAITIKGEAFYSDQWRIDEIFRNLISNAIKHLDADKSENHISITANIDAGQAQISIEDNGIGMSLVILPHVFDMFYRGTTHAEGSGIGLYIVKNAIKTLRGEIKIWSEEADGTRFDILLPNHAKPEAKRKA